MLSNDQAFLEQLRKGLAGSNELVLEFGHVPDVRTPVDLLAAASDATVIVADVALVEFGPVRAVTPTGLPTDSGPELILRFQSLGLAALDIVLRHRARGCIDSTIAATTFVRAVRCVAEGELWLPRWMLETVYERALGEEEHPGRRRPLEPELRLTRREIEVLRLVRSGLTNKQVAQRMDISASTVKKHLHNALAKRGLFRRRQAYE